MTIPPNAHVILGLVFLGFTVLLAVTNWKNRDRGSERRKEK
jgi:hypothetical protein